MTGEDLMMLADDISMQAGALDAIGDKAGRNAVDGGQIEQAMRHVSSLKMALAKICDNRSPVCVGSDPDMGYDNRREAGADEELALLDAFLEGLR